MISTPSDLRRLDEDQRAILRPAAAGAPLGVSTEHGDTSLAGRQLWILFGQLGVMIAVVLGFGAYQGVGVNDPVPPRLFAVLMVTTAIGTILLGPPKQIDRVLVGIPILAYLGWWVASALWVSDVSSFVVQMQLSVALVGSLVVFASLLPTPYFGRALVAGCAAAIGWTIVHTVMFPTVSMSHADGLPGWKGGFIHKNTMAPFMVFAVLVFQSFEPSARLRWLGTIVATVFIVMSDSTTALVIGVALIVFAWFLNRLCNSRPQVRPTLLVGAALAGMVASVAVIATLPLVLAGAGKDPTLTARTLIWSRVLEAAAERPWTGYGIGGVWMDRAAEPSRSIERGIGFEVFHSHNGLVEIYLLLGVVGVVLFLGVALGYLSASLRLMDSARALFLFLVLYGLLIVMLGISEVSTFGVWFALLAAFYTMALRRDAELAPPEQRRDVRRPRFVTSRAGAGA